MKHLSFGHIMHNLCLTRLLVSCRRWASLIRGEYTVSDVRICYDLAGSVPAGLKEKRANPAVIPDAWILFEKVTDGKHVSYPLFLEIDRGTMDRQRFKGHVRSRVELVRSGEYGKQFGTKAVLMVYATAGERPEYREARRRALCEWTTEVLREMRLSTWTGLFRLCAFSFGELYRSMPVGERVWYRPDGTSPGTGLFNADQRGHSLSLFRHEAVLCLF